MSLSAPKPWKRRLVAARCRSWRATLARLRGPGGRFSAAPFSFNRIVNGPLRILRAAPLFILESFFMSLVESSCAASSFFSFCCCGHCRRRARQAPIRFLFMVRSTRSTTDSAAMRPTQPHILRLSRAVGEAACAKRQLISARDRPICVRGRLIDGLVYLNVAYWGKRTSPRSALTST